MAVVSVTAAHTRAGSALGALPAPRSDARAHLRAPRLLAAAAAHPAPRQRIKQLRDGKRETEHRSEG